MFDFYKFNETSVWVDEIDPHRQKAAIWTQLLLDTRGSTWHKGILNVPAKRKDVIT